MKQNRILLIITAFLMLIGTSSCRRHTIIPDRELAEIFHDVFLANAYTAPDMRRIDLDSLRIYEPILQRYGYTTEDIQYTIGNFSKRKSAKLGDVVEVAIAKLEDEGEFYKREVAILDTINNVAERTFRRTIYADTLIRVRKLKDTTRLKMQFDLRPGEYTIDLDYLVDSLDENSRKGLRGEMWVERNDQKRVFAYNISLQRDDVEHFRRRITTDTTHKTLNINFLKFNGKPQRPSVTVRDLKIEYRPLTEVAVDSLFIKQLNIRLFTDDYFRAFAPKTDSLPSAVEQQ